MEIPVANVYYLLCYAWDKLEERDLVDIHPTEETDLVNLFARVLTNGIDHLLKKGIDRGYLLHSEESCVLRGRIDFPQSIKHMLFQRAQAHCEFDELSFDVLHNRILKSTIMRLIRTRDLDSGIRDRLLFQYRYFAEVGDLDLSVQIFGKVQLYRNNHFYDFLLRVCALLFENLLPTQEPGNWRFRSFLQNREQMAYVFERFVRNFYKRELPSVRVDGRCKVKREDINWGMTPSDDLSSALLPKMQTDVCITTEAKRILVECKYVDDPLEQREEMAPKLITTHLYQVNAYLDNWPDLPLYRSSRAILLYPLATRPIAVEFTRADGQLLSVRTLNLAQQWSAIHQDLLRLVDN
ncbi:McrC protein [Candidatus Koribacter versatilis Ellin345]|uniref:McrC protein n=1 Tax=Koribacter versatilis (strain Ellin345) TaxID=204669 RepID=Q1IK47_KORVE|nr:5-methylcytosine-specific restriction endonuclease system specificity protein McrC [Candidatus Koribacter versatilis]ABF42753.1 McrC protein [Candidatus Koribacter versatilis Ellin345]